MVTIEGNLVYYTYYAIITAQSTVRVNDGGGTGKRQKFFC